MSWLLCQDKTQLRSLLLLLKETKTAIHFACWTTTETLWSRWLYASGSEVTNLRCPPRWRRKVDAFRPNNPDLSFFPVLWFVHCVVHCFVQLLYSPMQKLSIQGALSTQGHAFVVGKKETSPPLQCLSLSWNFLCSSAGGVSWGLES